MRGKKIGEDVEVAVDLLHSDGLSPRQIEKHMKANADLLGGRKPPSLTWIKRRVRHPGPKAEALPPWSITEASAEEVNLVQPALRAVLVGTEGRISNFTVAQAAMIASIARRSGSLRPWFTWRIAASYLLAEERGRPADKAALDLLLTFRPWETKGAMIAFMQWTIRHRPDWYETATWVVGEDDVRRGLPGLVKGGITDGRLVTWEEVPMAAAPVPIEPIGVTVGLRPRNIAAILALQIAEDLGWAWVWGRQPPAPPAEDEVAPHSEEENDGKA